MKYKTKKLIVRISWILFIIYIAGLCYFLFFSESYGRTGTAHEYRYNLVLFKEIRRFIEYRNELGFTSFIVNIFGNVFAFSPFGFVLPIISPKNRKFLNVTLLGLEFTIMIEVTQLVFKVGIFDVDDIFLNTVGCIVGYVAFAICNHLAGRKKIQRRLR
ncbi:VanZ family protein [Anaeromicropila herbilytica]|uniref:VanZ-like domain-containing protein n=1 Tax=Anaeromicropila herbilytica TaxID=2785025 RepID=A0A7R7EJA8_9FIRM|nr:VanZ family protein [Anaeromicropila herbilytica]BCN29832.1 hypothetical protein bsdtb5_11270 [Anaeromicropila herbilytica]